MDDIYTDTMSIAMKCLEEIRSKNTFFKIFKFEAAFNVNICLERAKFQISFNMLCTSLEALPSTSALYII